MEELKKLSHLLGCDVAKISHLAYCKQKTAIELILELMSILNLSGMQDYKKVSKAVSLINIQEIEYTNKPYQAI